MTVCAILATCGRHTLLERSLRMFLDQENGLVGEGEHALYPIYRLLIYNNSDVELKMDNDIWGGVTGYKHVRLVNNHLDSRTGERYTNLGAIYNDALEYAQEWDPDVIVHWDDDDLFMPNHLMEGLKGFDRAQMRADSNAENGRDPSYYGAYKPAKSYFRHAGGITLMANTLEPSIFVDYNHIKQYGYSETTSDQHLQWVNPLVYGGHIFVDENGPSTLIYNWGDRDIPTFKTSGNAGDPKNFENYRNFSQDHGDKVITPWTREQLQPYYDLVQ